MGAGDEKREKRNVDVVCGMWYVKVEVECFLVVEGSRS